MQVPSPNKNKILNDPVYGFITIPSEIIFDIVEHPYFQRLRRISQLGLTYLVYPGAYHTRFHHAIGAMHLTGQAIGILRSKGHEITREEEDAVLTGILLHDIGHGPFSHVLENSIVQGIKHETLSHLFMQRLNSLFNGRLALAIEIFQDRYHKKFLHQLIASQLDMDRLDYLRRDSFYTGVSEGKINSERLLTMLNVSGDQLVVDAKGIYSVEKFIIARRLMYWQVYLHKTVLSAEDLLVKILQRARELALRGEELFCTSALHFFLYGQHGKEDFLRDPDLLDRFAKLDDNDVLASVKEWVTCDDRLLAMLCKRLVNRKLLKIELRKKAFGKGEVKELRKKAAEHFSLSPKEAEYLVFTGKIANNAYDPEKDRINLLYKNGRLEDVAEAADQLNISALATTVTKHFICYPGEIV